MNLLIDAGNQVYVFLRRTLSTWHGCFTLLALVGCLPYLRVWLLLQIFRVRQGSDGFLLVVLALGLGIYGIWNKRQEISRFKAGEADRILGYMLILGGFILFPFLQLSDWFQASLFFFLMSGIVVSSYGFQFFSRYSLFSCLIVFAFFPRPRPLAEAILESLSIDNALATVMAHGGSLGLRLIGKSAIVEGTILALPPDGAVDIAWGCNGFDMAVTMAVSSWLLGLFLKQNKSAITIMVIIGTLLAFAFNIPRIVLLALASVYWGQSSFDFWHGAKGGLIFSSVLFTAYYYAVMAIIKRRPRKAANS